MRPLTFDTSAGEVTIRQIEPADREALSSSYDRWSVESRYKRFILPPSRLTNDQLSYLTEVDHVNHEAVVAFATQTREPVGVARYIRLADDPLQAEVAIAISDDWQGCGIGTALLAALTPRAVAAGITSFRAEMLSTNAPAHALMHKLAGAQSISHNGGVDTMYGLIAPPAESPGPTGGAE